MKVTIGGDRLGSGNKLKTNLNNYQRSTHNLGQKWTSSMTVGALYPFLILPAMRGDKFTIDLEAAARTIPTQGPLYGSFKMQLDVFQCPVRLYQAILHNNPLNIGLNMPNVKFPLIKCYTKGRKADHYHNMKFSNSCLMKYLGVSGLGRYTPTEGDGDTKQLRRDFNALPLLAYYDIFKTYYSNKQEEDAYVIATQPLQIKSKFVEWKSITNELRDPIDGYNIGNAPEMSITGAIKFTQPITAKEFCSRFDFGIYGITNDNEYDGSWEGSLNQMTGENGFTDEVFIYKQISGETVDRDSEETSDLWLYKIYADGQDIFNALNGGQGNATTFVMTIYNTTQEYKTKNMGSLPALYKFKIANIDDMRLKVLSFNNIGAPFYIDGKNNGENGLWGNNDGTGNDGYPYILNSINDADDDATSNSMPLNGLMIKTYQSDIFNCWVNTEWIDGENGIAAITAVATSDGKFTMDSLNLAEKLYDMLNRIAVSDGTYESWQDTVYTESPRRHIESPVYLGGMSNEVVFEEIVQTTPTETEPLGNMGGRGVLVKRKGGHVVVNVDEASFIIGIVSLTPRINYTQGNEFYMTDLFSMDDFHKPALDGIGFQNLMAERLAWFGTGISNNGPTTRQVVGKVPAWLEYMTAIDKAYGDFAEDGGKAFMVLNRNYEHLPNGGGISDVTTYIDPTKYNYAFAYKNLDAQNFWVQIKSNIKARRLMSAKQIPNL